jgi:hypothetical protein
MNDATCDSKKTRPMLSTWRGRVLAALLVVALLAGIAGAVYYREVELAYRQWRNKLPHSVWQRLHSAKSVTLYSLYPSGVEYPGGKIFWLDGTTWDELRALPKLERYPVLGQFECSDPGLFQLIADDLLEGTQEGGPRFQCFSPRHGLQLKDEDGTLELLICLECRRLEIHEEGKLPSGHLLEMAPSSRSIVQWTAEHTRRGIRMAKTKH